MIRLKFKAILFDLDGTLLDTSGLIVDSFKYAFKVHYKKELESEKVHAFFGKSLRSAMEYLGPDKVEELITTYRDHHLRYHDELIDVFPKVPEVLESLHKKGIKLAIVTSKTQKTAIRGLEIFDIKRYFPVVIGINECINPKPHPEPIQNAMQFLSVHADECLMVGDSTADLMSGRNAGLRTAAVKWTHVNWQDILHQKPNYVLETMEDLLSKRKAKME